MPCMQQTSARVKQAYNYRFLAHDLASVSYSQRGSDTNRCGTPAQSDRFTLHCQPRDHVFWQCSTYWYRNNRFIYGTSGYNSCRLQTTVRRGGTGCAATLCTLFMSQLGPRFDEVHYGSGTAR